VSAHDPSTDLYEHDLAPWVNRGAALVIDGILLFFGYLLIGGLTALGRDGGPHRGVAGMVAVVVTALYFGVAHARYGQTVGKRLLGIRVVSLEDPAALLGYGRAFGRWLMAWLAGWLVVPAVVDYLWPIWDERKQTLHDKIARSVVVRAD
jgi:uncharacterized RDD family membrane protein YckC